MESQLSIQTIIMLLSIMLLGGLVPSISSLTVLSRTASLGISHGLATIAGIIAGDIIFILIALYGLALLAASFGVVFKLLLFVGAAYVIYLGTLQWQQTFKNMNIEKLESSPVWSSLLTGLLITLADQKAVLFYFGFLPAMLDLEKVNIADSAVILLVTIFGLACAKLCYLVMGKRSINLVKNEKVTLVINKISGGLLILVGAYIMLTT